MLSAYLGWRSLGGAEKDAWIRTFAIAYAAMGGTSFYNADFTGADFTGAILKSTDLRAKTLDRVSWHNAKKLDLARVGNAILAQPAVRQLLIEGNGHNKIYANADLNGANLNGATLSQANLKGANLDRATLQKANLEWANLSEVQALRADFTGACFTGACLESWNIDASTILDNVDCQYIFLLEQPNAQGSRERHPHDPDKIFSTRRLRETLPQNHEYRTGFAPRRR
ncbi:MAG: pentapeptide repeat-containing protein [Chloroflexaceae bacterium]|nr:pentapeptide repeat-containing protein [Chloroflexaceae bacterium]